MSKLLLAALGLTLGASTAGAQTCLHYWDFESDADVVGGLATVQVGSPTLALDATYGEAYPGSNASLNTVNGGLAAGGGFLEADTFDGTNPTALILGTADFSFSYWAYDDTSDADGRGPRVFDFLEGTDVGLQLGTNLTNDFNLRIDDDLGGSTITNNSLAIQMPTDQWVHVAVNVDRAASQVEIHFNGVSQGTVVLASGPTAAIHPSMDLRIGVINNGNDGTGAQKSGLDDLAFYSGLLSQGDITALASGAITPAAFGPGPGTSYCYGNGSGTTCPCGNLAAGLGGCANSTGAGAVLAASGSASVAADDLVLNGSQLPPGIPSLFFQGTIQVSGGAGNLFGDGLLCAGGQIQRMEVRIVDGSGNCSTTVNIASSYGAVVGQTNTMQLWYRDPSGPCGGQFNTTNGLLISWQ